MPTCMKRGGYSSLYSARIRSPSLPVRSCGVRMKNMSPPPEACRSCSRIYTRHLQTADPVNEASKSSKCLTRHWCVLNEGCTLAFFFMCLRSGWTAWGPGWAKAPKEYFFRGGRWNWRSFIGPIWVGKKGCRSSSAGMECCYKEKKWIPYAAHSTRLVILPSFDFTESKYKQLVQKLVSLKYIFFFFF